MSEEQTQQQLEEKKERLIQDIKSLNDVIEASNTPVFEILINEVKREMQQNIAIENWKGLKENKKQVESYRSVEKIIQNQHELLERKKQELEEIEEQLKYYQQNLFEKDSEE